MLYNKVVLKKEYKNIDSDAYIEIFRPYYNDNKPLETTDCILVCPGGGYEYASSRESDPIAIKFLNLGYTVATISYTCKTEKLKGNLYPKPFLEVMAAMDYLNNHADELAINKNKISMIGFSAGGHLTAAYAYLYKNKEFLKLINTKEETVKPYALCLCYPVITFTSSTHGGSKVNLSGDLNLVEELSCEKHVDGSYPPTYLWTTKDDNVVPYQNTMMMRDALKEAGVKFELKLYPHGPHGLATADLLTNPLSRCNKKIAKWPELFDKFLKNL